MKRLLVAFCLLTSTQAFGGIAQDLEHFFAQVGMNANVNQGGVYMDQKAGYYTGGSMMVRSQVRQIQPFSIQTPGWKMGCGRFDAWLGGFSHISAKELVDALRNVASNAASYAFMLAIQTATPQIYNLMTELNALATKVNNFNTNSCETAATMLGGVWPRTDQSQQLLCQAMGSQFGVFSDMAASRQGCGAKGQRWNVLDRSSEDPRYKNILVGNFNITWKALQVNAFLSQDNQLARLFMTMAGSIISHRTGEGEGHSVHTLPGLGDREELLSALLNGGNTPIYRCSDGDPCLSPQLGKEQIAPDKAFLPRVRGILESLVNKIYESQHLTASEKDFLNSTRLPVYKMLNVITAYRRGSAPLDVDQYSDLIALDILFKYVLDVMDLTHESVLKLKAAQVEDTHIERFLKDLRTAKERVVLKRNSAYQYMDQVLAFVQSTQLIEKQLHVMMGTTANETNWL